LESEVNTLRSGEVLQLLQISRQTLGRYVKNGTIKVTELPNGRYDYDEQSVYQIFNKGVSRKTYIYARVSTAKQKIEPLSMEKSPVAMDRGCIVLLHNTTFKRFRESSPYA